MLHEIFVVFVLRSLPPVSILRVFPNQLRKCMAGGRGGEAGGRGGEGRGVGKIQLYMEKQCITLTTYTRGGLLIWAKTTPKSKHNPILFHELQFR